MALISLLSVRVPAGGLSDSEVSEPGVGSSSIPERPVDVVRSAGDAVSPCLSL